MTRRIFKTIFLSTMLVLIISLALFITSLHGYFESQVFDELGVEAHYISRGMEGMGLEYFNDLESDNRITYIASDGTVIYDSSADPSKMENHSDREEIMYALKIGESVSSRYSGTLSENTLYYALRLSDNTILRIASRQSTVWALFTSLLGQFLLTIILAGAICLFLSRRLSRRITAPILALDLDHPEKCDTYEELSPLLVKINHQNGTIKQQMKTLRKSQEEFTAITENMSEGFLLIDDQANLLSYNSSALKLLGSQEAERGKSVLTLERGESFRKVVDDALAGKHSEALMRVDERCHQLYANSVYHNDQVVGAVIAVLDVTEREERETLRREFTANVTHELKTPLTSISGFAEIIMNRLVDSKTVPEFAGDIYTEAQRLITLVNDILHISELDEGVAMPREEISLDALCRTIFSRLSPAADKAGVELILSGDKPMVLGVERVIDDIIYNLCDNAIKYNRAGGSVRATITDALGSVCLSISDTGIGISPGDIDRVFERFYRVDKSHSKEIGGTGLGLSIVKHGCTSQGIAMSINSELNVGTTIFLRWYK